MERLTEKQKLRIQTRHKNSIERFGYQPQALFWSNREIQEIRFQKILDILPPAKKLEATNWKILDVGCGFADLLKFLEASRYYPDYLGIDISSDMVQAATAMCKGLNVQQGELADFNFENEQFDFVVLSGALNEVVETEVEGTEHLKGSYAKSVISEMYRVAKYGVAFNLLDARNSWVKNRSDLQSFMPDEVVEFCSKLAPHVELIDGYLENDFTIHLLKKF